MTSDPRLRTIEGKIDLIADLETSPSDRAVPLLLELLCDKSWAVRERAVVALAVRGSEVVEPVMSLLGNGLWYTRACAANALGQIGAMEGIDALAGHFADENPTVRKSVLGALAMMAARHGAGPVREALARAGTTLDPGFERALADADAGADADTDAEADGQNPEREP